jgi:CelD/BcsL family acetyltransferase involved in cellulose biosynthesis
VTIRDRGGLVAAAPLWVESVRLLGVVRLRRLLFVGHRDSDYLDVLVARGREAECVELLAEHLSSRADLFDVAVLEETPDRSPAGLLLCEALRRRGWPTTRSVEELCPRTALLGTWEETIGAFELRHRRELRRRLRNLERDFPVELEVVAGGAEVAAGMRSFIEMHQERWARDGYPGAIAGDRAAAFHRDVAERLGRRGWLFLAFLRVGGRRCAANYGFAFRGTLATYLTGVHHEEGIARHSPGRMLHAKSMQWAIASGRTHYDFMRGTEPYKYELDAVDVPNWTVVAYPRHPRRAAAAHHLDRAMAAVRRRAVREARALLATGRRSGWLSRAVLRHVARAAGRGLADVRRLLRRWRRA